MHLKDSHIHICTRTYALDPEGTRSVTPQLRHTYPSSLIKSTPGRVDSGKRSPCSVDHLAAEITGQFIDRAARNLSAFSVRGNPGWYKRAQFVRMVSKVAQLFPEVGTQPNHRLSFLPQRVRESLSHLTVHVRYSASCRPPQPVRTALCKYRT